jgi:ankyrin repeat protein
MSGRTSRFNESSLRILSPQQRANSNFLSALTRKDIVGISFVLAQGADIELKNRDGETGLIWASKEGLGKIAKKLLESEADPNATSYDNTTALHWAAKNGDVKTAARLIAAGADMEARNHVERTPLHEAAAYGKARIVALLIEKGADVKARWTVWDDEYTPLDMAMRYAHTETAALLRAEVNRCADMARKRLLQNLAQLKPRRY